MQRLNCPTCKGCKTIMGGGMIFHDCIDCGGTGKVEQPLDDIAYLEAVDKFKKRNPELPEEDAEKIFKEEFDKVKPKRGRAKRG